MFWSTNQNQFSPTSGREISSSVLGQTRLENTWVVVFGRRSANWRRCRGRKMGESETGFGLRLGGLCLAPARVAHVAPARPLSGLGLEPRVPRVQAAPNSLGGAAASCQSQKSLVFVKNGKK